MMKAITLWQPWAGAMAAGLKKIETRRNRCHHYGHVCIHAGSYDTPMELWTGLPDCIEDIPLPLRVRGHILCLVEIVGCAPTEALRPDEPERSFGDFSPGRYGILTQNLRALKRPVPCRGFQAVPWTVPPEVEAEVRRQLS